MKTYLKRNKMLFILPWALLPFVVLIFYILGGGRRADRDKSGHESIVGAGANYSLPEADRSIGIYDKMEAYQMKDTRTLTRDYHIAAGRDSAGKQLTDTATEQKSGEAGVPVSSEDPVALLDHIRQQGAQTRRHVEDESPVAVAVKRRTESGRAQTVAKNPDLNPTNISRSGKQKIPFTGMDELERVFRENNSLRRRNDSLAARLIQINDRIERMEVQKRKRLTVARTNVKGDTSDSVLQLPILAEVYETTTVLDGNRVKLRLLEGCTVRYQRLEANTFLYGICRVRNERLFIQITRLRVDGVFLPVDLVACDLDGLEGLYVPDNAARKVTKEVGTSTNTSSLFGMTSNPLTYAGVRAADQTTRALLQRVRLKKITIKKNTLVYLTNQN